MDEIMRAHAAELRAMRSEEAANWLLQKFPLSREAIILLEHVSLRRCDYRRLADHYLAGPTHASARAYRLFAQRLGLAGLIRILGQTSSCDDHDANLLAYHLKPMLNDAKNADELREAAAFVDRLVP